MTDIEKDNLLSDFCKFYCKSNYDCSYCLVEEFLDYFENELELKKGEK